MQNPQQHDNKRIQKIEVLCYKIFIGMPEGRELYDLLVQHYIVDMPVVDVGNMEHVTMAALREGNNAMIRLLKTYAEQYMQRAINEKTNEVVHGTSTSTANTTEPFYRPKAVKFDV